MTQALQATQIEAPAPIFNCPECSHWLPPGTIACPDCQAIVYAGHLRRLATAASEAEREQQWPVARDLWQTTLPWLPPGTTQVATVEQRIAQLNARIQAGVERKATWAKRLGPFAPFAAFLLKIKSLFFVLLKFKFLLSFMVFFALYWGLFGWKFGLGFTLSIAIHEMGHYVAARRRGLKVDLPVFLPGLGAYVRWYAMGVNLDDLAAIALAGPFLGLLTAAVCGVIAFYCDSPLFSALAHTGAWLNLLNLIPVFGLDGAQATLALTRVQRALVLATSVVLLVVSHEWVFCFIAIGMAIRVLPTPWRFNQAADPPSIRNPSPAPAFDAPDTPNSRAMVQFVLLLFTLGVIIYLFPESQRRF